MAAASSFRSPASSTFYYSTPTPPRQAVAGDLNPTRR
ncbi:CRISPR-associated protein Cas5 [Micromonospora sp. KC606]|nr:CRISPR-associated protein Cas5 [Micromonospora sp. KC606]